MAWITGLTIAGAVIVIRWHHIARRSIMIPNATHAARIGVLDAGVPFQIAEAADMATVEAGDSVAAGGTCAAMVLAAEPVDGGEEAAAAAAVIENELISV